MNKTEYHKYLKSEKWKLIRTHVLSRDSYKCRFCNSGLDLNVHHRSYEYIGREMKQLTDLVTMCRRCHSLLHVIEPVAPKPTPKPPVKKRVTKRNSALCKRRDVAESQLETLDAFVMSKERIDLILTKGCGLSKGAATFLGCGNKNGWKKRAIGKTYGTRQFIKLMHAATEREASP